MRLAAFTGARLLPRFSALLLAVLLLSDLSLQHGFNVPGEHDPKPVDGGAKSVR
jgi:hypothetical protein